MNKTAPTYQRLGDYIRLVDVRNTDLQVEKLVGLTIDKKFIPSVANVIGTDLSNYKIIKKKQFACSLMQVSRDEKIPIAMFDDKDAIMSPAYPMFEVNDTNVLLPEYLMMWFSRKEFDREASFYAVGGVRGSLTWEDFCNMYLPIPSIAEQQQIVSEYQTVQNRIDVETQCIASLQATAQTLYRKMFVDGIDKENLPEGWRVGTIGEYATVKSGYAFNSNWWQKKGVPVVKIGNISDNTICRMECDCVDEDKIELAKNYIANKGDIVIAMTGATLGKIAIVPSNGFLINQRVGLFNLGEKPFERLPFLYMVLKLDEVQNEILTVGGDSAQANVSNSDIEKIEIAIPNDASLNVFNQKGKIIFCNICNKKEEIEKLKEIQSLLLTKMGRKEEMV